MKGWGWWVQFWEGGLKETYPWWRTQCWNSKRTREFWAQLHHILPPTRRGTGRRGETWPSSLSYVTLKSPGGDSGNVAPVSSQRYCKNHWRLSSQALHRIVILGCNFNSQLLIWNNPFCTVLRMSRYWKGTTHWTRRDLPRWTLLLYTLLHVLESDVMQCVVCLRFGKTLPESWRQLISPRYRHLSTSIDGITFLNIHGVWTLK